MINSFLLLITIFSFSLFRASVTSSVSHDDKKLISELNTIILPDSKVQFKWNDEFFQYSLMNTIRLFSTYNARIFSDIQVLLKCIHNADSVEVKNQFKDQLILHLYRHEFTKIYELNIPTIFELFYFIQRSLSIRKYTLFMCPFLVNLLKCPVENNFEIAQIKFLIEIIFADAIKYNHFQLVQWLIRSKLIDYSHSRPNPLITAFDWKTFNSLQLLLDSGFDLSTKSSFNETYLHLLAQLEYPNTDGDVMKVRQLDRCKHFIIKILKTNQIDIDALDVAGLTASELAIKTGNHWFANILTEYQSIRST